MAPSDCIVVINAGSSSIKFSLFIGDGLDVGLTGKVEGLGTPHAHFIVRDAAGAVVGERRWEHGLTHAEAMAFLVDFSHGHLDGHRVAAIGHRIVHGGASYSRPLVLDAEVVEQLERLTPLAPLHQPHNLAPVRAMAAMAPQVLQVGCFDTAFHTTQPPLAQAYALPASVTSRGVKRYGFHGLAFEYLASHLPQADARLAGARVVAAHLGNGASMCALQGGRSVAATTGFTALDGLPMGTRCGALDPGVVLYLMEELKMEPAAIEHLLYAESGLLGVSGLSSDMRELEASDDPRARLAIELLVYRIGRELGSLAAALGGIDALVFSGGIGENSVRLRAAVCAGAAWLGVALDQERNRTPGAGVERISTPDSRVAVWVVPANEELMIARHTLALLERQP
ncbi:acetate/propionate family kinase [Oxalobacteraceae bacterium A2-2]